MRTKKIIGISALTLLAALGLFVFLNRDKFVYVGYIDIRDVDCSKKRELLEGVYESDQSIRKPNVPLKEFALQDHANQELVFSILEKCGMPTLAEVGQTQMDAVWLVLQHADGEYREKYFPLIVQAVDRGDLSKQNLALMKDRMLMDAGQPQLYGSQIKDGKLYELASPDSVDVWRKAMGMEPLKDYLRNFNIELEGE